MSVFASCAAKNVVGNKNFSVKQAALFYSDYELLENKGAILKSETEAAYAALLKDGDDLKEKLAVYDAQYFEENALIVVARFEPSMSIKVSVEKVTLSGETAVVTIERKIPSDDGDAAVKVWCFLIETEKTTAENVEVVCK